MQCRHATSQRSVLGNRRTTLMASLPAPLPDVRSATREEFVGDSTLSTPTVRVRLVNIASSLTRLRHPSS